MERKQWSPAVEAALGDGRVWAVLGELGKEKPLSHSPYCNPNPKTIPSPSRFTLHPSFTFQLPVQYLIGGEAGAWGRGL